MKLDDILSFAEIVDMAGLSVQENLYLSLNA
jgi:hypothetical protein